MINKSGQTQDYINKHFNKFIAGLLMVLLTVCGYLAIRPLSQYDKVNEITALQIKELNGSIGALKDIVIELKVVSDNRKSSLEEIKKMTEEMRSNIKDNEKRIERIEIKTAKQRTQ